jgi:hypothetical protein
LRERERERAGSFRNDNGMLILSAVSAFAFDPAARGYDFTPEMTQ